MNTALFLGALVVLNWITLETAAQVWVALFVAGFVVGVVERLRGSDDAR